MIVTIKYKGIELDCTGFITIDKDPYATGDSPTEVNVSFKSITLKNDDVNIYDLIEHDIDIIEKLAIEEWSKYGFK